MEGRLMLLRICALHRETEPPIGVPFIQDSPIRVTFLCILLLVVTSASSPAQESSNYVASYPSTATSNSKGVLSAEGNANLDDVYARLNALQASVDAMQSNPNWQRQPYAGSDPNTA